MQVSNFILSNGHSENIIKAWELREKKTKSDNLYEKQRKIYWKNSLKITTIRSKKVMQIKNKLRHQCLLVWVHPWVSIIAFVRIKKEWEKAEAEAKIDGR